MRLYSCECSTPKKKEKSAWTLMHTHIIACHYVHCLKSSILFSFDLICAQISLHSLSNEVEFSSHENEWEREREQAKKKPRKKDDEESIYRVEHVCQLLNFIVCSRKQPAQSSAKKRTVICRDILFHSFVFFRLNFHQSNLWTWVIYHAIKNKSTVQQETNKMNQWL